MAKIESPEFSSGLVPGNWNAAEKARFGNPYHEVARDLIPFVFERLKGGIEVEILRDELPAEGPALIIYNHPGHESTLYVPYVVYEFTDRPTAMVVKHTLSDPNAVESDAMLKKTGKKRDLLNIKKPGGPIRRTIAAVMNNGAGAIPVNREKPSHTFFRDVNDALRNDLIVGLSLLRTRTDEDDLSEAMPGAAYIMQENPDVPVYLFAMTNMRVKTPDPMDEKRSPHMSISPRFTLRDIDPNFADRKLRMSREQIHEYIVNKMEQLVLRQLPAVKR